MVAKSRIRTIFILAVLVSAVLVPGILLAARPALFPGLELGAQLAGDRGLATEVDAHDTQNGITFRVVGFIADETQTVISYTIRGREAEGAVAFTASPQLLIDSDGNSYRQVRGSQDQADRRQGTWVFPPIQAVAGTLTV